MAKRVVRKQQAAAAVAIALAVHVGALRRVVHAKVLDNEPNAAALAGQCDLLNCKAPNCGCMLCNVPHEHERAVPLQEWCAVCCVCVVVGLAGSH